MLGNCLRPLSTLSSLCLCEKGTLGPQSTPAGVTLPQFFMMDTVGPHSCLQAAEAGYCGEATVVWIGSPGSLYPERLYPSSQSQRFEPGQLPKCPLPLMEEADILLRRRWTPVERQCTPGSVLPSMHRAMVTMRSTVSWMCTNP